MDIIKPRTYEASFDDVWESSVEIVEESELDLVYKVKEHGDILAQRPITAFSWGENVFINILKVDEIKTQVKVSCKRALSVNVTATNWNDYIISKLDEKYTSNKK